MDNFATCNGFWYFDFVTFEQRVPFQILNPYISIQNLLRNVQYLIEVVLIIEPYSPLVISGNTPVDALQVKILNDLIGNILDLYGDAILEQGGFSENSVLFVDKIDDAWVVTGFKAKD